MCDLGKKKGQKGLWDQTYLVGDIHAISSRGHEGEKGKNGGQRPNWLANWKGGGRPKNPNQRKIRQVGLWELGGRTGVHWGDS